MITKDFIGNALINYRFSLKYHLSKFKRLTVFNGFCLLLLLIIDIYSLLINTDNELLIIVTLIKLLSFGLSISILSSLFDMKKRIMQNDPAKIIAELMANIKHLQGDLSRYQEFIDRHEVVLKSTRNVIWDYNFETKESYFNDSIHRLFGYRANDIKHNPNWWQHNIHPEDKQRVLEKLEKCISNNYLIWEDEYRLRCANGEYKIVEDHGFIKRRENGVAYRLLGFMNDITEQRLLQKQLIEEGIAHKLELAKAISHAQEAERKNISEELHDNVCQILGGVKLFIEHCRNSETKNEGLLGQSAMYLNAAIVEVRKMTHCLSPHFVEEFGLISGINELIFFATNFRNASVQLEIAHFDETILSNSQKLLLYRILQEQLNNIVKHSHATAISIEFGNTGNSCLFAIRDNGAGMQISDKKQGLGLKNIRNRVELLNGQMHIISSPGNGFCLKIEFEA